MDKLLTINGKAYKAQKFGCGFLCDLENRGWKLDEINEHMFNFVRLYVARSMKVDEKTAEEEIDAHFENGGSLDDISDVIAEMMDESGFFRGQSQNKKTSNPERTRKKKSESEEVIS